MEVRKARLIVNKSGSGSQTTRVTIPKTWIDKMGVLDDRGLLLVFDGKEIIIKKEGATQKSEGTT